MEMSPNQVRTATFGSARKGFDPAEVTAFLDRAAAALEAAQNHATAMEARARAAVAKLQEISAAGSAVSSPTSSPASAPHPESETISRTLLLAQRAADEAIAEARAEAERLVEEARQQARQVGAAEQQQVRSEVDALAARREFLHADVEQLENFLLDQRERLRTAAASLVQVAERVPDGLGYLRPPVLSASDESEAAAGVIDPRSIELEFGPADRERSASTDDAADDEASRDDSSDHDSSDHDSSDHDSSGGDPSDDAASREVPLGDETPDRDVSSDPTEAMPVIRLSDDDGVPSADRASDDPTPESTQLPLGRGGQPGPTRWSGR